MVKFSKTPLPTSRLIKKYVNVETSSMYQHNQNFIWIIQASIKIPRCLVSTYVRDCVRC